MAWRVAMICRERLSGIDSIYYCVLGEVMAVCSVENLFRFAVNCGADGTVKQKINALRTTYVCIFLYIIHVFP